MCCVILSCFVYVNDCQPMIFYFFNFDCVLLISCATDCFFKFWLHVMILIRIFNFVIEFWIYDVISTSVILLLLSVTLAPTLVLSTTDVG